VSACGVLAKRILSAIVNVLVSMAMGGVFVFLLCWPSTMACVTCSRALAVATETITMSALAATSLAWVKN
jgi:hypothetical protein